MPNLYQDSARPAAPTPPLEGVGRADVIVVGAGFTGLSTALHLAEKGVNVMVLDAQGPGWGASGRNGGQVNPGLKHDPDVMEADFGEDLGSRMNALAGAAPALVFDLVRRHDIPCDARRHGTLRAAVGERHAALVRTSARQLMRRDAPVEIWEGAALARATGTDRYAAAMFDPRGGDLNPLEYARGLARAAVRAGARVHGQSCALSIAPEGPRWRVTTPSGEVSAAHVVLATNGYTDDLWPGLRRTLVPVFGAIAATAPLPKALADVVLPDRSVLYESGAITVYYRVDAAGRLIIGGRGPMREIESPSAITAHREIRDETLAGVAGRRLDACVGRPPRDDARCLSASARARSRHSREPRLQRPGRRHGHHHGPRARRAHSRSRGADRHAGYRDEGNPAASPVAAGGAGRDRARAAGRFPGL